MSNNNDPSDGDNDGSYQAGNPTNYNDDRSGRVRVNHDDGDTVRVSFRSNQGSIWDVAKSGDFGNDGNLHGGLNNGGLQTSSGAGDETHVSVRSGPPDLGGFTAVTSAGRYPVLNAADLQPTDLVTLPDGTETEYAVALMHNLLRPEALQAQRAEQEKIEQEAEKEQQEAEKAESKRERNDERTETIMKEAVSTPEGMAAVANLGDDLIASGGDLTDNMVKEFANAQRIQPEEAKARIEHVKAAYSAEAARAASRDTGAPEWLCQEALNAARSDGDLMQLARDHFATGRPNGRGYGQYVLDHVAQLADTSEGRDKIIAANPHRARLALDGSVVVRLDSGSEVSWGVAVTRRLIKLNN